MVTKPYQTIPIVECNEPLVPIPLERFAVESPHPYLKLGADYGGRSPFQLRQGVVEALILAQEKLQQSYPGWRLKIFDAYRPVAVQQYMVDFTFSQAMKARGLSLESLTAVERSELWQAVLQIWALPNEDPKKPPPHSTGAAIDLTLVNETGQTLDMGGVIDEMSERSHPQYYQRHQSDEAMGFHSRRQVLHTVMAAAGFQRHPGEWWHFSLGDQMWAWRCQQDNMEHAFTARYGRWYEA